MFIVRSHRGLRKLKIIVSSDSLNPDDFVALMNDLLVMLQHSSIIDVYVVSPSKQNSILLEPLFTWDYCRSTASCAAASHYQEREQEMTRSALLSSALMECARHDARRTFLLLTDNLDAVCMLLLRDGGAERTTLLFRLQSISKNTN